MARGRFISKSLSTSRKFAGLHQTAGDLAEFSQALYCLLVAHADDFGRLDGDPWTVKHAILPASPRTVTDVTKALALIANAELIAWYDATIPGTDKNVKVVQIQLFDEHQQGLHRRTKSLFPEYPGSSGKLPDLQESPGMSGLSRSRREVEVEEKGREEKLDPDQNADRDLEKPYPHARTSSARARSDGDLPSADENGHVEPVWTNRRYGAPTLVGNHLKCYQTDACARGLCVPAYAAQRWLGQISKDEPLQGDAYVQAFVKTVLATTPEGPIGDDPLDFWRNHWATKHGVTTAPPPKFENKAARHKRIFDAAKAKHGVKP